MTVQGLLEVGKGQAASGFSVVCDAGAATVLVGTFLAAGAAFLAGASFLAGATFSASADFLAATFLTGAVFLAGAGLVAATVFTVTSLGAFA